ncbi:MAG: UvrD-helicase domain-containing protein, partial [Alphaproteobacteria bacterium]|nr:UvrD-helicase domain-containing protein [Alphaproteobacteria bacterium]
MPTQSSINPEQFKATDPIVSCWVTASAGTGKTKMLIDRLLRLLLSGADPKRIICITYTKAAANEMMERLQHVLLSWSTLPLDSLEKEVLSLQQITPLPHQVMLAKTLFHKIMERPLTIQTIHSFCQRILSQFPLEAGILPECQVLDEPRSRELKENAIKRILQSETHSELLTTISAFISESHLKDSLLSGLSMTSKIHPNAKENRRAFFQDSNALNVTLSGADGDAIYTMAL